MWQTSWIDYKRVIQPERQNVLTTANSQNSNLAEDFQIIEANSLQIDFFKVKEINKIFRVTEENWQDCLIMYNVYVEI